MMNFLRGNNLNKAKLWVCIKRLLDNNNASINGSVDKENKNINQNNKKDDNEIIKKVKRIIEEIGKVILKFPKEVEEEVMIQLRDNPHIFMFDILLHDEEEASFLIEYVQTNIMTHIYDWLSLYLPEEVVDNARKDRELMIGFLMQQEEWLLEKLVNKVFETRMRLIFKPFRRLFLL
ncbi:hypothetical protein CWI42_010040 [Ordospora colligata]|uniref:Uncharacterized protein n=1 Tax=Ordospora colligata OC4 TaxID=1354746 RepID=A0A0B2ULZ0_9MICR|nr:uncharacterized protein M896_010040 [Ordospora colligata OC4]KHN70353.1 hypothetical protein M896_010040 [Ordospora colligata OC4]TBU17103.1 hypothetical protein CWI41_010040 [Ordospora colligata]TBU17353.1 hypothetical protein CWI40_010040 [Ordospora colligata]TBU19533.1 hypothetical protein CWI42_010040 [Ordospora colligata]